MDEYLVKFKWFWGDSSRFKEEYEFSIYDRSQLRKHLEDYIIKISRRYTFDCGRIDHPLRPSLSSIKIIPIISEKYIDPSELGLDKFLENESEWTKELIETKNIYIEGGYNFEPSPKNKESRKRHGS